MTKMLNKALCFMLCSLLLVTALPISAIASEPTCKGKDDHYAECGNIGRWFASRAAAEEAIIPFSEELDAELDAQYHTGEIDYCTYNYYRHDGYESWSCAGCGKWTSNAYSSYVDKGYDDGLKPYCQWDEGTVTTQPTCTTKGKKSVTCTYCNRRKTLETAALGHKWNSGSVTTQPTCTATGVKTFTCTRSGCSATKTSDVAALGHNYQTVSGENTAKHICKRCSDEVICKSASVGSYQKTTVEQAGINKEGRTVTSTCCSYCDLLLCETSLPINAITTVELSNNVFTYNGKAKKPSVTVKDSGCKKLSKDTDFAVSYSKGRKSVGEYSVTVTFKGNYKGTKTLKFKIIPKATKLKSLKGKKKAISVNWKKAKGISGYQIQCATDSKYTKGKKTVTVKGASKKKTTVKKLKGRKKYYVRIRTYKTVNGKKIYSKWSKSRKVTTK